MSQTRRSLILAGGGMRVAYQAGVIKALAEAGIQFDHVDGASGGTMNLAMLLSGLTPDEMIARWKSLDVHKFVSLMPFAKYTSPKGLEAMGDARGLVNDVFPHLGIDIATIRACTRPVGTFNVCNFSRKTGEVIPNAHMTMDHIVASVSLPIFMPAVPVNGSLYLDAVWIRDANPLEAVRRGADELWIVWCIGNTGEYHDGVFRQYVHMIEIAANGALFKDFDQINEINTRIAAGEKVYGHTAPIRLHLIRPEYPLPLDPDFYLGKIDAARWSAAATLTPQHISNTRTEAGLPFSPEVTHMANETPGFTFREKMSGGFALGETDPETGAQARPHRRKRFTMHGTINIDDLARFMSDPNHPAPSPAPSISSRWARLFPPPQVSSTSSRPRTTQDEVHGLRAWLQRQQTASPITWRAEKRSKTRRSPTCGKPRPRFTLELHQGNDKTGPVVGAGVLTLALLTCWR